MTGPTIEQVREGFGTDPLISDWVEVTQEKMDDFGRTTDDWDWMHNDPDRAKSEGFDSTIAFGFWTLSMLTAFLRQAQGREYPPGVKFGYNYGLDRVRFLAPVPVGSRIRNHLQLVDVRDKGGDRFLIKTHNEVEVEGQEGPVMVAEWLVMFAY